MKSLGEALGAVQQEVTNMTKKKAGPQVNKPTNAQEMQAAFLKIAQAPDVGKLGF